MWRAHKPRAIHGSKTLDQLTTNYLFIGWRPKISWSFLFSRYWLQLAVWLHQPVEGKNVSSFEIGMHTELLWGVCGAACVCDLFQPTNAFEGTSLKRKWHPVSMQGFNTLCFSSSCQWERTDGLSINARCQWVKTRLCFVSDLQASIMSGKEMDCSGLWLDYDYFFKASLRWADRRVPLQQGEGLRVTESPMLSRGWKNKHRHLRYQMCVMKAPEPQSSGAKDRRNHHSTFFFLKQLSQMFQCFLLINIDSLPINCTLKIFLWIFTMWWQITAAGSSNPPCNLQFTHCV